MHFLFKYKIICLCCFCYCNYEKGALGVEDRPPPMVFVSLWPHTPFMSISCPSHPRPPHPSHPSPSHPSPSRPSPSHVHLIHIHHIPSHPRPPHPSHPPHPSPTVHDDGLCDVVCVVSRGDLSAPTAHRADVEGVTAQNTTKGTRVLPPSLLRYSIERETIKLFVGNNGKRKMIVWWIAFDGLME